MKAETRPPTTNGRPEDRADRLVQSLCFRRLETAAGWMNAGPMKDLIGVNVPDSRDHALVQ
jgi:hypothetical protein